MRSIPGRLQNTITSSPADFSCRSPICHPSWDQSDEPGRMENSSESKIALGTSWLAHRSRRSHQEEQARNRGKASPKGGGAKERRRGTPHRGGAEAEG